MEDTAFHQEYHTLHTGIRSGVDTLAIEACSKDLVCEEVKNKATSATGGDARARALLDGVQDRIKTDPGAFYKFVALLKGQAAYEHLAKKLETRIGELHSHPKSVAESQRYNTAYDTDRGMPNRRGSLFSGCPSETGIGNSASRIPFVNRATPTGTRPIFGHPETPTSLRSYSGYRQTPTAAGPRPISGRPETSPGPRPITSCSRRETPIAAGPRPISSPSPSPSPSPNQKTDPHPFELDPSSVRPEGDSGYIGSPDSSFSSISTDGEDVEDVSTESSEQITVLTTAPTPVSEKQLISGPCKPSGIVPEQEQGNMGTPVVNSQSHSGSKLTVTMPRRSDSTDSNEFVTPPTSPQPGPIQESSSEGASTTALAGGDYSQPSTYHHRKRITELEEKLSKNKALLQEREKELGASEGTKRRLLRRDKQCKEYKKLLQESQSNLETAECRIWDQQAELSSAYQTIDNQQREISELKKQLELLDTKAYAYDEIRKNEALEKRLEEVQRRLDRVELQHDGMTQQCSY